MNAHETKQLEVRFTRAKAKRDGAKAEFEPAQDAYKCALLAVESLESQLKRATTDLVIAQVSKNLDYIDKDIEDNPEHLIKPDPEMLAKIDELVEGIEIEEQPEDVILAALKAALAFIDAMLSFYGTNLEVANWHLNGDLQSRDSFFDNNKRGDELELLNAAIKKAEGTELISGRVEAVEDGGQRKALLGEIRKGLKGLVLVQGKGLPLGYPCEWVDRILDELEAKL